jgi:catechol 2,3-dioxygenase-like lactoylglutathione lyase family enzyme
MRYLHTMLRVRNLDQALDFYCNKLKLKEARRRVDEKNRYTLVFLAARDDESRVEESKRTGRGGRNKFRRCSPSRDRFEVNFRRTTNQRSCS